MRRSFSSSGLVVLALALLAGAPRSASAQSAEAPVPHQLSVYFPLGAMAQLSSARTIGGAGGGLGLQDTIQERFLIRADARYLLGLGNVLGVQLSAGIQRRGAYSPALLATLSLLLGEQLRFLTPEHPVPVAHPATALGITVAPLRFVSNGTVLSVLQLGVGIGSELPGLALQYHLDVAEVGISF